ncbi:hypothetical protein HA402_007474 [Bradysia odoriphaga]|nr:hypothetical protein HA402_007474 [Bradysia odoriphaga]
MEQQVDVLKPISLMLKFFRLCGLWPRQSKYQWLYRIYTLIFHLFFTVAFDFCKHINLFLETDLRLLTVGFFIFLAEISLVARSVNLLVNFTNISKCLDVAKEMSLLDKNEVRIVERNLSFYSKVMYFYMGSSTTACIFSWGAPLFSSEPMLPYPGWYPVDWKTNNQSYWLAYWYQVIGTAYQAHAIVLLQLFSIYLMANIGARYDVLKYRLANLGQFLSLAIYSSELDKSTGKIQEVRRFVHGNAEH